MYLMPTHIPVYVDGARRFIDDSWYADLVLARDFLGPHFGPVVVVGPSLPVSESAAQKLHEVRDDDDIVAHPSIDARTRVRDWPAAARRWRADLEALLPRAHVVHASVDDPFRPMQLAGLRLGMRAGKPTALIGFDMDVWAVLHAQFHELGPKQRVLSVARSMGMDLWMRWACGRASVAMLKEGAVWERYKSYAANGHAFCHTMHTEAQLVGDDEFEARLRGTLDGRRIKLGYAGRFVRRKGLLDALEIVARAVGRGNDVEYELVGWGEQQDELVARVKALGLGDRVSFTEPIAYGTALHEKLRTFDALLFTPTEEDTPRMLYDAYAAGLPVVGTKIPFLRMRQSSDQAALLFGVSDVEAGVQALETLHRDRGAFADLARQSRAAGQRHTVESWYGRRVEWTLEAVERFHRSGPRR